MDVRMCEGDGRVKGGVAAVREGVTGGVKGGIMEVWMGLCMEL